MKVGRSVPDPAPPGSRRPPAYTNSNSHWWDASQVYGCDGVVSASLRSESGGKLKMDTAGKLLPLDPETGIDCPKHLQDLKRDNGETFDLAAVDALAIPEDGVPRYNQFRRLVHKEPVTSFDEITDNPEWRKQIQQVYGNNIEMVDLMTGLYAEPLPEGSASATPRSGSSS